MEQPSWCSLVSPLPCSSLLDLLFSMNTLKLSGDLLKSKRFKSFYWRTGMMALAGFLALVVENLTVLELSPQLTVILGLVLGEVSKQIMNNFSGK